MVETIVRVAEDTVDEMTNSEGREVRLEDDFVPQLPFLLPEDGYSCDIVRGVPGGLVEFVAPLQQVEKLEESTLKVCKLTFISTSVRLASA